MVNPVRNTAAKSETLLPGGRAACDQRALISPDPEPGRPELMSAAEGVRGPTRYARMGAEKGSGQVLALPFVFSQAERCRRDIEVCQLLSAERTAGDIRDGEVNSSRHCPILRVAVH